MGFRDSLGFPLKGPIRFLETVCKGYIESFEGSTRVYTALSGSLNHRRGSTRQGFKIEAFKGLGLRVLRVLGFKRFRDFRR